MQATKRRHGDAWLAVDGGGAGRWLSGPGGVGSGTPHRQAWSCRRLGDTACARVGFRRWAKPSGNCQRVAPSAGQSGEACAPCSERTADSHRAPCGVSAVRPEKATQRCDGLYKIPVPRVRCPDQSGQRRDQVPCSEAIGGTLDSTSSSCAMRGVGCSGQGGFAATLAGRRELRVIAPSRGLGRRELVARNRAIHSKSDFIDIGRARCGGVSLSHSCDTTVAV